MSTAIITSIVTAGSNSHPTTSYEANAFATDFVGQGIVGSIANTLGVAPATGGFAVNAQASPAMFVDVSAGAAWITATPTSQASQSLRAYMSAAYTSYAISSNSSGSTKYDWIYLKVDPTKAANPEAAADDVTILYTSRSSVNTTDDNAPPTYGILLAVVTVANGASSIANSNIKDGRTQATPSAQVTATGTGWTATSAPNSCTANGNRSYSVVFNSTDLTGVLSPGMRVKATRTVTAPTQCTSLNGTTQFYNKTSPSGTTFTDDFVVSAWIKITSYPTDMAIISRYNGTSGWRMTITAAGQVQVAGFNASSANFSYVVSTQSVPLNRWVHVAAQLDMSAFTATPTTSYTMIDGVDVPAVVARGGTSPTALVQAGNLEIGGNNAGLLPFNGKIAQAAYYSAKVTQATIKASINQTLTGSETSLVSAYSFNNTMNDLSATANNLTAQASAVATTADTPYSGGTVGTTEYGIITAASFSTNTTVTVQVPEGYALPTTGGISAVAYSTHVTPYGFPGLSRFRLSAWDTSGTLTNPQIVLMLQYVMSDPIDGLQFANTGTAAGSMFMAVRGSEKLFWVLSANQTTGAAPASYTFAFPTSFFTTVQSTIASPINMTTRADQYSAVNAQSTSSMAVYLVSPGGAAAAGISALTIGT